MLWTSKHSPLLVLRVTWAATADEQTGAQRGSVTRPRPSPILQDIKCNRLDVSCPDAQTHFKSLNSIPLAAALFSVQWSQGVGPLGLTHRHTGYTGIAETTSLPQSLPPPGWLIPRLVVGPSHSKPLIYLKMGARYCLPPRQCLALSGQAELGGGRDNQRLFLIL